MSGGIHCRCTGPRPERMKNWRVRDYKCNHSAFNGYHRTPSAYSAVRCGKCGFTWRTKAPYVEKLENME